MEFSVSHFLCCVRWERLSWLLRRVAAGRMSMLAVHVYAAEGSSWCVRCGCRPVLVFSVFPPLVAQLGAGVRLALRIVNARLA